MLKAPFTSFIVKVFFFSVKIVEVEKNATNLYVTQICYLYINVSFNIFASHR